MYQIVYDFLVVFHGDISADGFDPFILNTTYAIIYILLVVLGLFIVKIYKYFSDLLNFKDMGGGEIKETRFPKWKKKK
jgi:hypothetical protein